MKKKQLLILCMLMLINIGLAHAQTEDQVIFTPSTTVYTYVQQDGTPVAENGLATFDVSSSPSVEFVDGKAVMTVGGKTMTRLPMSNKGELAVEFKKPTAAEFEGVEENVVTVKVTSAGMGTFYSPFRGSFYADMDTDSDVKVYAPTFDSENWVLNCTEDTEIKSYTIIPAGTALLLKNAGTASFVITADDYEDADVASALSGAAVKTLKSSVEVGDGEAIYTLGHENTTGIFGFFEYTKDYLNAGKAYLVAERLNSDEVKYIGINNSDNATAIKDLTPAITQGQGVRKYLEKGHVIIVRNGQKYNTNGQKIK